MPQQDIFNLLVENLASLQVPVGDYTLDITGHGSTESFSAPLSSFGGGSGVVYASGFLAPAATSAFALVLTTPNR